MLAVVRTWSNNGFHKDLEQCWLSRGCTSASKHVPLSSTNFEAAKFLGATMVATTAKLSLNIDDVAWLLSFTIGPKRLWFVSLYLLLMQLVVVAAWILSTLGGASMPVWGGWSAERIFSLVSAVLLGIYAVKLFHEWYGHGWHDNTEANELPSGSHPSGHEAAGAADTLHKTCHKAEPRHQLKLLDMIFIVIVGSLNDTFVFTGMLTSDLCSVLHLCIGDFIGSMCIVTICLFAASFEFVRMAVTRLPPWVVIGIYAAWSCITTACLR